MPAGMAVVRGSSPLTRGKRCRRTQAACREGLIPAHAGKTGAGRRPHPGGQAHPRSRGENLTGRQGLGKSWGSSPLTRGKPRPVVLARIRAGLIPAHAGKTCFWSCLRAASRAHPRSRGENLVRPGRRPAHAGSSPLTRGKRPSGCPRPCLRGLIPAHAGKTGEAVERRACSEAHPRSRGENGCR